MIMLFRNYQKSPLLPQTYGRLLAQQRPRWTNPAVWKRIGGKDP